MCILLDLCVMALGRFLYSWCDGKVRVVLSVYSASSRLFFGRCLSPLCSFACIAFAVSMYMSVRPSKVVCFSRIGVQSETPSSHRGASFFNSMSEYLSEWHWFRSCLA